MTTAMSASRSGSLTGRKKGIGTELMNRMIDYMKEKHIYMVSVIFEEKLKGFYERFGFYTMLSGQLETYESR